MKCFVINLDRRPDRLKQFTDSFNDIFEITRESAIDNKDIEMMMNTIPEFKTRINEWNFKYIPHKVNNIVACCLSHINVWKKISKMNDSKPVFVFEDDCAFINNDVKTHFRKYFDNLVLPNDFGIIWFNGNIQDKPNTNTNPDSSFILKEYTGNNTAESYLISPSFAKELIAAIENDLGAVDEHMKLYTMKTKNKSFRLFPPFFCQFNRNDTDIQISR